MSLPQGLATKVLSTHKGVSNEKDSPSLHKISNRRFAGAHRREQLLQCCLTLHCSWPHPELDGVARYE